MSRLGKLFLFLAGISLVAMVITRYLLGEWVNFCWVALGFVVVFTVATIFVDRFFFKDFFAMKTTKHGMNMGVLILLVISFLVLINFLAVRNYKTFDFSMGKGQTLSDQSIKLIKGLDSDLKIIFFYKKGVQGVEEQRRLFRDLVKRYQDQSPFVKLDFVEVNERPDLAKDFGVDKGSGTVFLEYKGKRNRIEKIEEQDITNALVKVTRNKLKTIYFTVGHGEKNLEDNQEASGLNALKLLLENNQYSVKTLVLNQSPTVPEDADILAIVGPQQAFLDFEVKAILEFLKKGKSLVLAYEQTNNSIGLDLLWKELGVSPKNNFIYTIIDTPMGRGINQGPTLGAVFSSQHPVTKDFRQEIVRLQTPTALDVNTTNNSLSYDKIVQTAPASMAFESLKITGQGPIGPFAVGVSVSGKFKTEDANSMMALVFGDADFLTNAMLYQNLNRDLALNSMAYLSKEENLISITPKEPMITKMMLTETNFRIFVFAFILMVPLVLLSVSVGLWLRRRSA